jgi:hypothetical protein
MSDAKTTIRATTMMTTTTTTMMTTTTTTTPRWRGVGRGGAALVVAILASFGPACSRGAAPLDVAPAHAGGAATTATTSSPPTTRPLLPLTHPSGVGTNLAELRDYGSERPFNDAFKQSRAWISTSGDTWDDGQPIDTDARGNVTKLRPGQRARSLVFWGDGIAFPKGTYRVTWDGTGELDFWPQGGTSTSKKNGSFALAADPARGGLAITITRTDPADPIRDLRVLLPDADGTQRWNPAFLARLQGYSTLRFMDWMETNASPLQAPGDRPVVDDVRYTTKGVPAEVIADLCNQAKTDCWVNVGHTWDDALVAAVATTLRDTLDPVLRLYVEHSNEVWNGQFPVAEYARSRGVAAGLAKDEFEAQLRWHAKRTHEVHGIFDRVWDAKGATGPRRVVRVLGAWAANAWSTGVMLDQLKKDGRVVDVVAIAPYFGGSLGEPEQRGVVQGMGLPDLLARLDKSVDESLGWVAEQKKLCAERGVGLVAYEGGQHLVGIGPVADDAIVNRLFDAANTDPKMKDLYLRYLKGWKDAGGGLFVHFNSTMAPSKYGRWGALVSMEQPRAEAPKYDALQTFIAANPRWY